MVTQNNGKDIYLVSTPLGIYTNWQGHVVKISGETKLLCKKVSNKETFSYYELTLKSIRLDQSELKSDFPFLDEVSNCDYGSRSSNSDLIIPETNGLLYKHAYRINVYFHVIRSSNGLGVDKAEISNEIITSLNKFYRSSNITFINYGNEYIDNDSYINLDRQGYHKFINQTYKNHYIPNCINLYLFSFGSTGNLAGVAHDIPSDAFLLTSTLYTSNFVPAHEMGHCLGLYHTHHGTMQSEGGIPELVNGSNSASTGDYIIDTPADPNKWSDGEFNDVTGISSYHDANGEFYRPDPTNIMSYSWEGYKFTQKQIERITYLLDNNAVLKSYSTPIIKNIIGPTTLPQKQGVYSVDVPEGSDVVWNIRITNSGNNIQPTIYQNYKGKSITFINPASSAQSQKADFSISIKTPDNIQYSHFETITRGIAPVFDSVLNWSFESPNSGVIVFNGTLDPAGSQISPIKIRPNGTLYFNYSGTDGISSTQDPYRYTYKIDDIEKYKFLEAGSKPYSFNVRNATVGSSGSFLLLITGPNTQRIMSIPYAVRSEISVNDIEDEDVETMISIDSQNENI